MTHTLGLPLVAGLLLTTVIVPAWAAPPLPDQRAIQSHCNERAAQKGEDFNACVQTQTQSLRSRNLECARQSQLQDVRTADLAAFMKRCTAADSFAEFREQETTQRSAAGLTTGQPVTVAQETLARWTQYDGAVALRISRVLMTQWIGPWQDGQAHGPGELLAEFEHIKGAFNERGEVGTVHLAGTMNRGQLTGTVKALKHPAMANSKNVAEENQFAEGRSQGLVVNHGAGCEPAPSNWGATATRFYGHCRQGRPYAGLVVYEFRQQAFDVACMSAGSLGQRAELDAFTPCEPFWRLLPDHCVAGDYSGQCQGGQPHGIGVRKSVRQDAVNTTGMGVLAALPNPFSPGNRSYYLQRGSFRQGQLQGYGYAGKLEGCGMAGCTGDSGEQLGWFDKDQLRFPCSEMGDCFKNLSGADYTRTLLAGTASGNNKPGAVIDYASALAAFQASGDRQHLRQAAQWARNADERKTLEFELIRIAGFDKVFSSSAVLSAQGAEHIRFDEIERVLGFVRSTDSKVPLRVSWEVRNDPERVALNDGQYQLTMHIGLRARIKRTSCVLNVCRDQIVTEVFETRVQPVLSKAQPRASGSFDLRQSMNSASMMFGMATLSDLVALEPFVQVEAVRAQP